MVALILLVLIMSALNGVFLCDMVLKGLVLSICESLTVNVSNIKPIRTGAKWGLGNKGEQGSLCRSFSGCDDARVIISEIFFTSSMFLFLAKVWGFKGWFPCKYFMQSIAVW